MSDVRQIRVTVDKNGQTKTEFSGFVGVVCDKEAAKLRAELLRRGIMIANLSYEAKPERIAQGSTDEQHQQSAHQQ